jgi:peptidoglycan/xylan/chitin deacetylase (PgdA/CDA1 family)
MKKLSLTFDDGPSASTVPLLDVLRCHSVTATFFQIGKWSNKSISALIGASGHELANHSQRHIDLRRKLYADLIDEICVDGVLEHRYFRPPYGFYDYAVLQAVQDMDLQFVLWDIDSFDYALTTADSIEQQIDEQIGDGGIMLFHDGDSRSMNANRAVTVEVVDRIIPKYRAMGYEFVPLSEMEFPGKPRKTIL